MSRLIAADESLARRVAKLFEMKEAVAKLTPDVVVVAVAQPRSRMRLIAALALATVLFAAVFGAVFWTETARMTPNGTMAQGPIADAVSLHDHGRRNAHRLRAPPTLRLAYSSANSLSRGSRWPP